MFKKGQFYSIVLIIIFILLYPFLYKLMGLITHSKVDGFLEYMSVGSGKYIYISFLFTFLYMFTTVIGQLILGFSAAYLTFFSSKPKLYLIIFFAPYVLPLFLSTLSVRIGYEGNGYITNFIRNCFSDDYFPLSNNITHFLLISILSVWQYFPFIFVFSYTMMKRINKIYLTSSIVDGASNNVIFRKILIPNTSKIIFPLIILRLLFMFSKYDVVVLFAKSNYPNQKSIKLLPILLHKLFNSANITYNNYALIIVIFSGFFLVLFSFSLYRLFNYLIRKI